MMTMILLVTVMRDVPKTRHLWSICTDVRLRIIYASERRYVFVDNPMNGMLPVSAKKTTIAIYSDV